MKKVILFYVLLCSSYICFAQKDVTTFMGIPVDGLKSEMKKQLISKGYTNIQFDKGECFKGEFNGTDVHIYIGTNNNKVYRLMVCDQDYRDEADIKIRFNKLVKQFENNKRYTSLKDQSIGQDVDISYEMLVEKKIFEAIFYQNPIPEKFDSLEIQNRIVKGLLERNFSKEQVENKTDEVVEAINEITSEIAIEILSMKPVWFRINEDGSGKYYISIFYDNEYNKANGEDL